MAQEIEATIIVCSERPQTVVTALAGLLSVGEYNLRPCSSLSIRDSYFDTKDSELRKARFSLRVREVDTTRWLTMKGPPNRLGDGIVEHLELEIPWSLKALSQITEELESGGVQLPTTRFPSDKGSPLEVLASRGLEQVQQRLNRRQVREVLDGRLEGKQILAELSIDSVVYQFGEHIVRHFEVEIEAKSDSGVAALPTITQALGSLYPSVLQRWDYGKLVTGRAIEALLEQGKLKGLTGNDHELLPPAYREIHQSLISGSW